MKPFTAGALALWLTTAATQPISLIEPSEQAIWRAGDTMTIRWSADFALVADVAIDLSVDSGRTWVSLTPDVDTWIHSGDTASYEGNVGTFRWVVAKRAFSIEQWDSVSLASNACILRVWDPYSFERHGDHLQAISSRFTITATASRNMKARMRGTRRECAAAAGQIYFLSGRLVGHAGRGAPAASVVSIVSGRDARPHRRTIDFLITRIP
jgi:hypothetical protein